LKAQIEGMDFREKNRKYSKYDRTAFYNNIEGIFQELSLVATKTDPYEFFGFQGKYLTDVKKETFRVIEAKVIDLCQNLKNMTDARFSGKETLNVLGQK